MKKIIFFIVIMAGLVLISGSTYAQSLEFNQVRQAVSYPNCFVRGIAIDASSGDIVVTGYFGGVSIFEMEKLDTGGANDVFIARYDDTGSLLWVKQAGGSNTDEAYGIATDTSGNSIVVGRFFGTATFGEAPGVVILTSTSTNDMFVAKYGPDGNLIWAKQAGGIEDYDAYGYSVATDSAGNIYVTGRFLGTIFSGDHQITSTGFWDVFIAKYNSNGDMQWSKKAGGSAEDQGNGIGIDASGNVVVTGSFLGTATFGSGETELTGAGGNDLFVAKFDSSNGNLIWAKSAGGLGHDEGNGITTDGTGKIFVTGSFEGTEDNPATFGTTDLVSSGGKDIFIAKYTAPGDMAFVKKAGGTENDIGRGIATEATTGDIVVTGEFSEAATFDGTELVSSGQTDVFIARYSASGALVSAFKAGGIESDAGQGVAARGEDGIICTGQFKGVASFGNISVASPANNELFVAFIGEAALPPGVPGDWSGNGQVGLEDAIGILQFMSKMRE